MSNRNLDPYLVELLAKNTKFEKPFYDFMLENKLNEYLYNFANTPGWVLDKLFNSLKEGDYSRDTIVRHPNFDQKKIDDLIAKDDSNLMSGLVHNPSLSQSQLTAISDGSDKLTASWAHYYLIRNTPEIENFIKQQLSIKSEDRIFTLRSALRDEELSETTVALIAKHAEEPISGNSGDSIGSALALNQFLSEESRALLHLLGFNKNENEEQFSLYPSSIFVTKKSESAGSFEDEITQALFALGHPLGLVSGGNNGQLESLTEADIFQLFESEFLHRTFWRELSDEISNFRLNFRNGYRVQDLFINHPTISHEFDGSDFDDGWKVGGVLKGYLDRKWVYKDSYISPDQILFLMNTADAESLDEVTEDQEQFSSVTPFVLAYLRDVEAGQDFCSEYGIELTEKATEEIENTAYEIADSEDYEVDVDFSDSFEEFLSWKSLPTKNQNSLFEVLMCGLTCQSSRLKRDSEHFLACIALHPATPPALTDKLQKLDSEVIQSSLKVR